MLVELTSDKQAQLNKWFKVRSIDGGPVVDVYIRFARVFDTNGNPLYTIPANDRVVYVEMEYSGSGYP